MTDNETVLEALQIKKSFKSPDGSFIDVIKGASFSMRGGESVSMRGESGAGKTTFMNIISCLEAPGAGEVFWAGARVDNLSNSRQARLRAGFMGFVFQNYCLMPELTALENVEFAGRILGVGAGRRRARARELLAAVGLKDRMNYLPEKLSGGERQRVAIARAVANSPRVMLADEPTGNLDETTAKLVMDILLSLCRQNNTALLLITHNPDFAKMTDRQVVLSGGVIA